MDDDAKKAFSEELLETALRAQMIKNFAGMRKARQQGRAFEAAMEVEALRTKRAMEKMTIIDDDAQMSKEAYARLTKPARKWHQQPQPTRTYTGHVARLDGASDKDICPHPSNIIIGCKIIGQWFICRREGGQYEFVNHAEWERLKPLVPIYGERVGDRMVIYDRIIAEGRSGHGYRERIITDQELIDVGYRAEFRGKSIDQMIVDSIVPDKKWEVSFDKVVAHGEVWAVYYLNADNHIHILEQGPEEVKKPAKKRAKPVDFFPNKIDRIAKMPRYPGVWG